MSLSFSPGGGGFRGPRSSLRGYRDVTGKAFDWGIARRLLQFLKPHTTPMLWGTFLVLVSSGLALLIPYLIGKTIDDYIAYKDLAGLTTMGLVTLAAYSANFLATWQRRLVLNRVGNDLLRTLRQEMFEHYQILSMSYYDKNESGTLISRMLSDVGVIHELLSQGLITMLSDLVVLVSTIIVMLAFDARLTLLSLSVLPVMLVLTLWFAGRARKAYRLTRQTVGALTGRLSEDLSAMRVIQAFAEEERTSREFATLNAQSRDANLAAIRLSALFTPAMEMLTMVVTAIILWFGGRGVVAGTLTIGTMVAFLSYTERLFRPILDLTSIFTTWQAAMAGGERIFEILDQTPDIQDAPDAIDLTDIRGQIEFENVSFRYVENAPVLNNINVSIKPGDTVALVGPTGAGKTTFTSLMMRFYDVDEGAIRIDGHDIRDVRVSSLRRQLGVVPQEPFLFQGSIAFNIAFGRPDASIDDIVEAAQAANVHDFVMSLPDGYDTEVLEESANLSLGQRQLICLARVILAKPRILVLDEATSSVDLRTEGLMQEALEQLMAGRTSLVIAHRLATVRRASTILVIDDGRIVERGTHEELLARGGVYAHLYETQFMAPAPESV